MKSKKKPTKRCACGRIIKQKYYKICVHCRQERKRQKKVDREIRNIIKQELEKG